MCGDPVAVRVLMNSKGNRSCKFPPGAKNKVRRKNWQKEIRNPIWDFTHILQIT